MQITEIKQNANNSRFVMEPMEKGSGIIVGNVLKEILMSSGFIEYGAKPVKSVNMDIEAYCRCNLQDCDRLIMDISTNGKITPKAAVTLAASLLEEYINGMVKQIQEATIITDELCPDFDAEIIQLRISARTNNALRRNYIKTIGELISKNEEELLEMKGMGIKSVDEIVKKLKSKGLSLRSDDIEK